VLVGLEHLLGSDEFLLMRGLGVRLDTAMRAAVAERVSGALAFLHRHAIVVGDLAPSNVLVAFGHSGPEVCFIDCDSMRFRGRQALAAVETGDWEIPAAFGESPASRAADAYKLGLVILRLLARSHDARAAGPHRAHVPAELQGLLARALAPVAVNRPPAGEWQRALRGLLAHGGLAERCPGPRPRVRLAPVPAPSIARAAVPASLPPPAPPPRRSRPRVHVFTLAWLVIAAIVLALILVRLWSAVLPSQGDGGFGSGTGGGGGPSLYVPDGGQGP